MRKPKQRIPVAKPGYAHSTKKDYNRKDNDIQMLECKKCGQQFFVTVIDKVIDLCLGCNSERS